MAKRIIIVLVVAALLGAAGWWAWTEYGDGSAEETGGIAGSGTVEAEEVAIAPVIAGRIASVEIERGAEVSSGTVLFELDGEVLDLQVDQAVAGVKAAQAALDMVKADKGAQTEIDQAQARLDQANAALQMARVQAGYATIASPLEGKVTQLTAAAGESVAPGKTLAVITDLTKLHVSVYIAETEIGQIELGDTAVVTTDSSDRTFTGTVVLIASEPEFTPSNIETKDQRVKLVYEVRLDVEDGDDVLKPGMPVDVEFE